MASMKIKLKMSPVEYVRVAVDMIRRCIATFQPWEFELGKRKIPTAVSFPAGFLCV
jgi:hypothetical protein